MRNTVTKKIIIVILWVCFGLSLGFVNDFFGHQWYNLYLNIAIIALSIIFFWSNKMLAIILSSFTCIALFLVDSYSYSDHIAFFFKIVIIFSVLGVKMYVLRKNKQVGS